MQGFHLKSTTEVASATLKYIKSRLKIAKDDTTRERGEREREKVKTLQCSNMYVFLQASPPGAIPLVCSVRPGRLQSKGGTEVCGLAHAF